MHFIRYKLPRSRGLKRCIWIWSNKWLKPTIKLDTNFPDLGDWNTFGRAIVVKSNFCIRYKLPRSRGLKPLQKKFYLCGCNRIRYKLPRSRGLKLCYEIHFVLLKKIKIRYKLPRSRGLKRCIFCLVDLHCSFVLDTNFPDLGDWNYVCAMVAITVYKSY